MYFSIVQLPPPYDLNRDGGWPQLQIAIPFFGPAGRYLELGFVICKNTIWRKRTEHRHLRQ